MKNSTLTKTFLAAMLGLLVASPSYANFSCTGKSNIVGVSTNGTVYVSIGFGIWEICNINSATGSLTPDVCKSLYAAMLAANKSNTSLRMYFNNATDSNNGPSCSAIGNWVGTPSFYDLETLAN
ncbi:MAG: hypothetical protein ABUS47_16275 [Steroidobacter sp.]